MEIFTSREATAQFSQCIRTLKSNHTTCCALVLEWAGDQTPPWLGPQAENLFIRPLAALTSHEYQPPCLLLLAEGPLVMVLQKPHYATYANLIAFFHQAAHNLHLAPGTFTPYDLTLEWSAFFIACTRINMRVGKGSAPASNQQYLQKLEQTLTASLSQTDDRHLKTTALRLLFVEDDTATRQLFTQLNGADDATITCAENGEQAIQAYALAPPHLVFLDINLPDITGLALLDILHRNDPQIYPIMLTSHSTPDQVSFAMRRRIKGYIVKPFNKQNIMDCIERYRRETGHA